MDERILRARARENLRENWGLSIAVAVVALAATLLMGRHFSNAILFIFITYILMNIVGACFKR